MKAPQLVISIAMLTLTPALAVSAELPSPIPASTRPAMYKLRPGDRVSIIVFGHEKLGVRNAEVDAKGELHVAGVSDPLPAAGLSVADLLAIAESRYKKSGVDNARVTVVVTKYAAR